jgi:DNA glycosylase AlkZ-like
VAGAGPRPPGALIAPRRIDAAERRARLGRRHFLAPTKRKPTPYEVAAGLVALHSSDPATVFLSVRARTGMKDVEPLERALYDERSLARILAMRRTMFVVPVDLVPVLHAAATQALVPAQRKRAVALVEEAGITDDGAAWLRRAEKATLAAIERRGEAAGAELTKDVPELQAQLSFGEGRTWAGTSGVVTRVVWLLAMEGHITRGRPRGSWISSQYRWVPMDAYVPGGVGSVPVDEARAELVRRWLRTFGPGTATDIRWWTGWTARATAAALAAIGAVEVALDEGVGYVLPDDVEPVKAPGPWVALLPGLDPTPMGWAQRDWYLGPHKAALFDRFGNIGPTVWCDGRIVGGWGQRPDGTVVYRLLEDIGAASTRAVAAAATSLTTWLRPVRVTPRFRTPLERELSS